MKSLLTILFATLICGSAAAQTKKYQITSGLSASVNHTAGSKVVQVLIPGVETIELDLSQTPTNAFLIKTADYNFDGYKDFAFTSKDPAVADASTVYDIFLYNPQAKSFEAPENPGGACGQFSNIRLNAADKTMRSSCRFGKKMSVDVFRWVTPFTLELTKTIDNSTEAQQDAAEEKAEQKSEKADTRKEIREDKADRRKEKKEERAEKDDDE